MPSHTKLSHTGGPTLLSAVRLRAVSLVVAGLILPACTQGSLTDVLGTGEENTQAAPTAIPATTLAASPAVWNLSVSPTLSDVTGLVTLTVTEKTPQQVPVVGDNPSDRLKLVGVTGAANVTLFGCSRTNTEGVATCSIRSDAVGTGLKVELISDASVQSESFSFTSIDTTNQAPLLSLSTAAGITLVSGNGQAGTPKFYKVPAGGSYNILMNATDPDSANTSAGQIQTLACGDYPVTIAGVNAPSVDVTAKTIAVALAPSLASAGFYSMTCTATDGLGKQGHLYFLFQVEASNYPPTLALHATTPISGDLSSGSGTGAVNDPKFFYLVRGQSGNVKLQAADSDGTIPNGNLSCPTYRAAITSAGAPLIDNTLKTITIPLAPTSSSTPGVYSFSCKAEDNSGGTKSYNFIVSVAGALNESPTVNLSSFGTAFADAGGVGTRLSRRYFTMDTQTAGNIVLVASDGNGDSLVGNLSCTNLPAFITPVFNGGSGLITLSVAPGYFGATTTYNFECSATDDQYLAQYYLKLKVTPAGSTYCSNPPGTGGGAAFAGGDGTSGNPYTICSNAQLQLVGSYLDKYFLLKQDLDLNAVTWTLIGSAGTNFTGSFDGDNRVISNLSYVASGSDDNVGMFSVLGVGGVIKNVELKNATISGGRNNFGALVGYNKGTVQKVKVSANVSAEANVGGIAGYNQGGAVVRQSAAIGTMYGSTNSDAQVGGVVGNNYGGTVKECFASTYNYSLGNIIGGLVGRNETGTIINSFAMSDSKNTDYGNNYYGPLAGADMNGVVTNSFGWGSTAGGGNVQGLLGYSSGTTVSGGPSYKNKGAEYGTTGVGSERTANEMVVTTNYSGWDFSGVWMQPESMVFPKLRWFWGSGTPTAPAANFCTGNTFLPFAGGTGSVEDPFLICTAAQLNQVRTQLWSHFKLLQDVNLTDLGAGWTPIGDEGKVFVGSFDGGGFAVRNLNINESSWNNVGLFARNSGLIKNLKIRDATIVANVQSALLAGWNYGTLKNVDVQGSLSQYGTSGLLAGVHLGVIYQAKVWGEIRARTTGAGNDQGIAVGVSRGAFLNQLAVLGGNERSSVSGIGDKHASVSGSATSAVFQDVTAEGWTFTWNIGGAVVANDDSSSITRALVQVEMTGNSNRSALVGLSNATTVAQSYRLIGPGYGDVGLGTGLNSLQAVTASSFSAWTDFSSNWVMEANVRRPRLAFTVDTGTRVAPAAGICVGNTGVPFGGGDGSRAHPFIICNATQLNAVRTEADRHFLQMADIDLSGVTGFPPIGTLAKPFIGEFDGNGKYLLNLTMSDSSADHFGLFGWTVGATLLNVNLRNASVTGASQVALLAGALMGNGLIQNCTAYGTVTGANELGGLAGRSMGTILNSRTVGSITVSGNGERAGGLVGFSTGSYFNTIESHMGFDRGSFQTNNVGGLIGLDVASRIYNGVANQISPIHFWNYGGGLIGYASGTSLNNSYAYNDVTGNSNQDATVGGQISATESGLYRASGAYYVGNGANMGSNLGAADIRTQSNFSTFDFTNVWTMTSGWDVPHLRIHANENGFKNGTNLCTTAVTSLYAGGLGTAASPYLLSSAAHLANVSCNPHAAFRLSTNLDLSGSTNWQPIGTLNNPFEGVLDGNGYTISNLSIARSGEDNVGLFSVTYNAVLKNFTLNNANILGQNAVGSVAGLLQGRMENVHVTGTVAVRGNLNIAALVGRNWGSIYKSSVRAGTVTVMNQVNNMGGISGESHTGFYFGVFNKANTALNNNSHQARNAGGIVGYARSVYIGNSYSRADITNYENAGGLIGLSVNGAAATIVQCYSASNRFAGGSSMALIGRNESSPTVTASFYDSGLTGDSGGWGTAKTTAELKTQSSFDAGTLTVLDQANDWDFRSTQDGVTGIWKIVGGAYPQLWFE